jgi:hypothetical protein
MPSKSVSDASSDTSQSSGPQSSGRRSSGPQASAPDSATPLAPALPNVNLVVATPCFGGQISVLYAASLFKLQSLVRTYSGFNLKLLFKDGDALITRARASLVSQFLDDPAATHLLFIDADIGFEPRFATRVRASS